MHILIGFLVVFAIIAFAFGEAAARNSARAMVLLAVAFGLLLVAIFALDMMRELPPGVLGKIPEDTPELRRTCAEWRSHPNDAPRMCFVALDAMERSR